MATKVPVLRGTGYFDLEQHMVSDQPQAPHDPEPMQTCKRCGRLRMKGNFQRSRDGSLHTTCKDCMRDLARVGQLAQIGQATKEENRAAIAPAPAPEAAELAGSITVAEWLDLGSSPSALALDGGLLLVWMSGGSIELLRRDGNGAGGNYLSESVARILVGERRGMVYW